METRIKVTLSVRLAILFHTLLGNLSKSLKPGDKFCIASVIRRLQKEGDWDPTISVFRLLEVQEFDAKNPDGTLMLDPTGQKQKVYRYPPEIFKNGTFPEFSLSSEEQGAILRGFAAAVSDQATNCADIAAILDLASEMGMEEHLTKLVPSTEETK